MFVEFKALEGRESVAVGRLRQIRPHPLPWTDIDARLPRSRRGSDESIQRFLYFKHSDLVLE